MKSSICPNCGCDKPKRFLNGRLQCADCKCTSHSPGFEQVIDENKNSSEEGDPDANS